VANLSKSTAVITWKGKGTTTTKYTYATVKPDKCTKGSSEVKETATVTGGTNTAIKKGQVGTLLLCIKGSTGISLLKGQKYTI
jgi:hypothetical protein